MARVYTRREVDRRKNSYLIFAGISDFIGAVLGIVVIIACGVLLAALVNWIIREGQASFSALVNIFNDALIRPE